MCSHVGVRTEISQVGGGRFRTQQKAKKLLLVSLKPELLVTATWGSLGELPLGSEVLPLAGVSE